MLTLDKRRPYGEVFGQGAAKFEQSGVLFDAGGVAIGGQMYEKRLAEAKARENGGVVAGCPQCKNSQAGTEFICAACGTEWKLVPGFPVSRWDAQQPKPKTTQIPAQPAPEAPEKFEFPEPTEIYRLPDESNIDDLSKQEIENALKHMAIEYNSRLRVDTLRQLLREKMAEEGML